MSHQHHYHILAFTNQTGPLVFVEPTFDSMEIKYKKAVQLIRDISGSEISSVEVTNTKLKDGSYAKWHACFEDSCAPVQIEQSQDIHSL